jgi:ethanolamine permease
MLNKTLSPLMIWGLGVGYVISGMYFGWNLGLNEGGPIGFLIATVIVTIMYISFVLSYAELSCAMPQAGGAFVYATKALGKWWGLLAGIGQWVEFAFAPPAIAAAIGAYFNIFFPQISPMSIAISAYFIFTGLNIFGVKHSAIFELFVTAFAVVELLIFSGVAGTHFSWAAFSQDGMPHGWSGIFASIPYAIWFYLAIEGLANIAEETKNPQRDLSRGFISAMATLVVLAVLVLFTAVGIKGWQSVVFIEGSNVTSDSPLPLALSYIISKNHWLYHMVITVGLFGLIASFHGIILASGRATMEFGRIGYGPKILSQLLKKRQTPAVALILNMIVGIGALLSGKTGDLIIISVFGALTMYIISMWSYFKLPKEILRPYKTPFAPFTPALALALSLLCLITMFYFNLKLGLVFLAIIAGGLIWFAVVNLARKI